MQTFIRKSRYASALLRLCLRTYVHACSLNDTNTYTAIITGTYTHSARTTVHAYIYMHIHTRVYEPSHGHAELSLIAPIMKDSFSATLVGVSVHLLASIFYVVAVATDYWRTIDTSRPQTMVSNEGLWGGTLNGVDVGVTADAQCSIMVAGQSVGEVSNCEELNVVRGQFATHAYKRVDPN